MYYFEKFPGRDRQWYWRFMSPNGREICRSTDGYVNEADCDHSIDLVKKQAPGAQVRRQAA
jgi:uncharacterized protein YegP (UPF0339 family)